MRTSQRRLLYAFAAVVVCFVAATTFAELRLASIDLAVREIAGRGLPSIQHLAAARTTLRQVERLLGDYVNSVSEGEPQSRFELDAARRRLDEEMRSYRQLPDFGVQRPGYDDARRALAALDDAIDRVFQRLDEHDFAGAHSRMLYDLGPAGQAFDESLLSLIESQVEGVHRLATHIARVRRDSMLSSFVLDASSVVLAVVAAWLALRTISRYTASLESQSLLLVRRADELEEFAGRVAHDVLSPLSTVALSLGMVERSTINDDKLRKMMLRGRSGLSRVEKIVEGLLAFARAGARPEEGARTELREAVDGVLDATREQAERAAVEVRVRSFPPVALACSAGVLDSMVANLVTNAIKYMGYDRPERRVELRVVDRGPLVRVEVEDTGPGLPPSLVDAVFEPYVRGVPGNQPGIGLGLATVKRITRAHGGQVGVRSSPGKGCCFWFELPKFATPPPGPV